MLSGVYILLGSLIKTFNLQKTDGSSFPPISLCYDKSEAIDFSLSEPKNTREGLEKGKELVIGINPATFSFTDLKTLVHSLRKIISCLPLMT